MQTVNLQIKNLVNCTIFSKLLSQMEVKLNQNTLKSKKSAIFLYNI